MFLKRRTRILWVLAVFGLLLESAFAQGPCITISRAAEGCAEPGEQVRITVTIESACGDALTALALRETLPAGWAYAGIADGSPNRPALESNPGALGTAEFAWVDLPAFPATFTYILAVPASETSQRTLSGAPIYRLAAGEQTGATVLTAVCFQAAGEGEGEGEGEMPGVPTITLNGEANVTVECGEPYDDAGATATDPEDGDLTPAIVRSGVVNTRVPGNYAVTFNVNDRDGNQAPQVVRFVTVADTRPPVIELTGPASIEHPCGTPYVELGALATDSCDLAVAVQIDGRVDAAEPGLYTLTYTATDDSGLSASVTRTVTVRDAEGPIITLNGANPLRVECGTPYEEPGATAIDSCDATSPEVTIENNTVDTSAPGTHTVRYRATDSNGFESAVTRQVIVEDTQPPVITLLGDNPLILDCGALFVDPNATALDVCGGELNVSSDAISLVDTSRANTVELTYSARDASGNAAFASRTVIVRGPACEGGALYCDLASFGVVQPLPRGDAARVYIPEGASSAPVLLAAEVAIETSANCETGTVRVTYDVDGAVQFSQAGPDGFPVTYFLGAGSHPVIAVAEVLETGDRIETAFTIDIAAAPDADGNGLLDAPFGVLEGDGDTWVAGTRAGSTDGRVAMSAWSGPCGGESGETIVLRLRNPEAPGQLLTVELERDLIDCGETAILTVAFANRIAALLGSVEAAKVPAPPAGAAANGPYFDISIAVQPEAGGAFAPIAASRLAARPIWITLSGISIDQPAEARFARFPTAVSPSGAGGFAINAGTGEWTETALENVTATGSALSASASNLSLFTPVAAATEPEKEGGPSCAPGSGAGSAPFTDAILIAGLLAVLAYAGRRRESAA